MGYAKFFQTQQILVRMFVRALELQFIICFGPDYTLYFKTDAVTSTSETHSTLISLQLVTFWTANGCYTCLPIAAVQVPAKRFAEVPIK